MQSNYNWHVHLPPHTKPQHHDHHHPAIQRNQPAELWVITESNRPVLYLESGLVGGSWSTGRWVNRAELSHLSVGAGHLWHQLTFLWFNKTSGIFFSPFIWMDVAEKMSSFCPIWMKLDECRLCCSNPWNNTSEPLINHGPLQQSWPVLSVAPTHLEGVFMQELFFPPSLHLTNKSLAENAS